MIPMRAVFHLKDPGRTILAQSGPALASFWSGIEDGAPWPPQGRLRSGWKATDMDGLTQLLANGWPLALAGFALGALAGGWAARKHAAEQRGPATLDGDAISALAEEVKAARALLEAQEAEAEEADAAIKELDDAVKRANDRLKLISNALKPPQ